MLDPDSVSGTRRLLWSPSGCRSGSCCLSS